MRLVDDLCALSNIVRSLSNIIYIRFVELKEKTILILDDDKSILDALKTTLEDQFGECVITTEPSRVAKLLDSVQPDILLTDMNFTPSQASGAEGLELIKQVHVRQPELPIIAMTAFGDVKLAVQSIKNGAADFIEKPWNNQRLISIISKLLQISESTTKLNRFTSINNAPSLDEDLGIIGESPEIKWVRERIKKVADSDANVLILGENGTGKDLAARAIHNLSSRKDKAFIKIDIGAIHENLFESELFGARKGAYTGIQENKAGRLSLANQGTLFLDELSNLYMPLQAKLLSVLQNREYTAVGGTKAEKIDIRLISATNTELKDLLDESRFRQDLLYRVNTIEINMPSLRSRQGDIEILMRHFLSKFSEKYNKSSLKLDQKLIKQAEEYDWPGNVRELQHAMERAVIMADGARIRAEELIPVRSNHSSAEQKDLNLQRMEEDLIKEALDRSAGSISKASKMLGITRTSLYRRIEKYDL